MTRRKSETLPRRALAAFLEGEVTPTEAAAIEAHLRDSAAARRQLEQLREIRRALARLPDERDDAETLAVQEIRCALLTASLPPARGPRASRWSWSLRAGASIIAAACAATAALLLVPGSPSPSTRSATALADQEPGEFRPKSAAATSFPEDRWVRIDVYRVAPDGAARPLGGAGAAMRAGEGLVFRYTNSGREPFGFLMIFAVDSTRRIHWYYPSYETAGTDPSSLPIRAESGSIALPDVIQHELSPGPLVLYGLFSRTPLRVLDVERRVNEFMAGPSWDPDRPARIPVAGSGQHVMRATVGR